MDLVIVNANFVVRKVLCWIYDYFQFVVEVVSSLYTHDETSNNVTELFFQRRRNFLHGTILGSVTCRKNVIGRLNPRIPIHAGRWRGAPSMPLGDVSGSTCRK